MRESTSSENYRGAREMPMTKSSGTNSLVSKPCYSSEAQSEPSCVLLRSFYSGPSAHVPVLRRFRNVLHGSYRGVARAYAHLQHITQPVLHFGSSRWLPPLPQPVSTWLHSQLGNHELDQRHVPDRETLGAGPRKSPDGALVQHTELPHIRFVRRVLVAGVIANQAQTPSKMHLQPPIVSDEFTPGRVST